MNEFRARVSILLSLLELRSASVTQLLVQCFQTTHLGHKKSVKINFIFSFLDFMTGSIIEIEFCSVLGLGKNIESVPIPAVAKMVGLKVAGLKVTGLKVTGLKVTGRKAAGL